MLLKEGKKEQRKGFLKERIRNERTGDEGRIDEENVNGGNGGWKEGRKEGKKERKKERK